MALSFEDLKKSRAENLLKNKQKFEAVTNTKQSFTNEDDGIWKPVTDKSGNGYAIIRFLPQPEDEDDPFVRVFSHGFQGPGGWYIEKSRTTIGEDDPVGAYNTVLWNSGKQDDARKQKRRLHYYSNIYVVKHPNRPEDEGKVFRFKYGKKIFDKLNSAMNPEFGDEEPMNPFDLWGGANFKLVVRKGDYGPDYSDSKFLESAPLLESDQEMENVWKQAGPLQDLIDPSTFKSYDELETKLTRVLNGTVRNPPNNVVAMPRGKTATAQNLAVNEEEDLTFSNVDDIFSELDELND